MVKDSSIKLAVIVSITTCCLMLVYGTLYGIETELSKINNINMDNFHRPLMLFIVLIFSVVILTGIFKNKKWALYSFISLVVFMTGAFFIGRIKLEHEMGLPDFFVGLSCVGLVSFILFFITQLKSDKIFTEY